MHAIDYILNVAGVPGVAAFIGVAMLVVMVSIGFFGPATREQAFEQIAH
jgi:putative MFS transporter